MKKLVLIISVVVTLFGVMITIFPLVIKATGLDEPLKAYFLPKIMDKEQGKLDFADYTVGLGRMYFSDVVVASDDGNYELKIKSLRISLNLLRLLRYPKEPQRAISDITMIEPDFIIRKQVIANDREIRKSAEEKINISAFIDILNQIQTISEISIRNGKVLFEDANRKQHYLGNQLSGSLTSDDLANLTVTTQGNLFNGVKQNLYTKARLNLNDQKFSAEIKINHHYRYETSYSFLPSDVQALEGDIYGNLIVQNKGLNIDSLLIDGLVIAENIQTVIDSNSIDQLGFRLKFNGAYVELQDGLGKFGGHPFHFSAHAEQFSNLRVTAQAVSKNMPLSTLRHYFKENTDLSDVVNLEADFALEEFEPILSVNIFSDSLKAIGPFPLTNLSTQLVWQPGDLQVEYLQAKMGDVKIAANARYDVDKSLISLNLTGKHSFKTHTVFDKLSNQTQSFSINLVHNLDSKYSNGKWQYIIGSSRDSLITVYGSVFGKDDQLSARIDTSNISELGGQIHLSQIFTSPVIGESRIIDLPIGYLITDKNLKKPFDNFNSVIELEGELQNLRGRIMISEKNDPQSQYLLIGEIKNLFSPKSQVRGSVKIKNMLTYYDFHILADSLGGFIASPEGIDGKISLDLADNDKLNGYLRFNNFDVLQSFSNDSVKVDNIQLQGSINGEILLDGTLRAPRLSAELQGDKFVFNSVGYYQGMVRAQVDTASCTFDSLSIDLNNLPLLTGYARWHFKDGSLDGRISGRNIDVVNLVSTFNPDNTYLTGLADYQIDLKGSVKYPWFEARAKINNGAIGNVEFDKLELALFDEISADSSIFDLTSHTIQVDDLSMSKKGLYHFTGEGRIPLSAKNPLDVKVNFDGDLLSFLPRVERFFLNGASLANAQLHIGGTFDEIRLIEGDVNIERGELWLRDVARHIENIEGKISLSQGSNEVNFTNFIARVDDQYLTINTVRDISLQSGRDLKPWYFKGLDLDFGVLALETSSEGVELNIPGLMAKEDAGKLYLSGRSEGQKFYFAGPVKNPVVFGNLTLYDTRLTYPFLTSGKPRTRESIAVRFLKKLNWDVIVTSGEDVKYYREIPAYIDNVDTELFVDETSQGLHLTGIINRGTFGAVGNISSSRGRLEYLDQNFKVDRFVIEFNKSVELPVISGKAWTTVRDSIGAAPKTIYLQLYVVDEETGMEKQQGGWEDFKFKLVSADPQIGETQKQVMAYLGFSADNVKEKATSVGGAVTEKYLIRPLLRPVEKVLEDNLGIDLVRINSSIARNLFYGSLGLAQKNDPSQVALNPFSTSSSYLMLMQSSEVTVGKYLAQNVFFTYTGQLVSVQNSANIDFGFNHSFGIEYRFFRNVLLEFEYDRELSNIYRYTDQQQYMDDFKIRLRHSFTF